MLAVRMTLNISYGVCLCPALIIYDRSESASAGVYLTQVSAPEGKTLKLALDCLRSLKRVG